MTDSIKILSNSDTTVAKVVASDTPAIVQIVQNNNDPAVVKVVPADQPAQVKIVSSEQPAVVQIVPNPGPEGPPGEDGVQGDPGPQGDPGVGVPAGGTTGQILSKIDDTDYNTEWSNPFTNTLKHLVKNDGVALTKGTPVYVSTASGTNMIVSAASNTSEATSSKTMGLLAQDLAINGQGYVITEGLLTGVNTSTAQQGDPIWLGPNGTLIYGLANKPYAPAHLVFIGIVTRVSGGQNQNTGEVFIRPQNGFELQEIHNVGIGYGNNVTDKSLLAYEAATSLWKNKTFSDLGIAQTTDVTHEASYLSASGNNENTLPGVENETTIDSFDSTQWRMMKYVISAMKNTGGANKYFATELTILIDSSNINVMEYGTIDNNGDVGTVNVTKVGTTVNVNYVPNLLVKPVTVRFYRTGLKA